MKFKVLQKKNIFFRTAYIRLSKEFHPDHNAGVDDAKMETIHNKVGYQEY